MNDGSGAAPRTIRLHRRSKFSAESYQINAFGGAVLDGFPANFAASSASATHLIRTGFNYRIDWPEPEGPIIVAQ
ncbi:hypothetical protein HUN39_12170 [Methylocystis sp. FS]|uniref:hypothetical protein n=1 Tax=Methylocystis silviterrae TaxID=2743612 RepID=UPI0015823CCA|nr:hypothetical protein [Methylocystis silviterrae]NUJ80771.1 hypothetical protein [Methylocystis silviterrae]